MRHIPYWIGCLLLLSACDSGNTPEIVSDYNGSFYTEEGRCKGSSKMSVNLNGNDVEVAFYCFVRACVKGTAKLSPSGYFEIDMGNQEFIHGRLSQDSVTGTWAVTMSRQQCRGRFEAERTRQY